MNDDVSMYRLVVLKGEEADFRTVIRETSVLVGRDQTCRVYLPDPSLAPQHLALRQHEGQVMLQVLQDAAPVMCNGEVLTEGRLQHGDVIEIGELHLQFQVVHPLPFHSTRRAGPVFKLAGIGLAAVLVLECLLVGWLWYAGPGLRQGRWAQARDGDPTAGAGAGTDPEIVLDLEAIWSPGGSVELLDEVETLRNRVATVDARVQRLGIAGPELAPTPPPPESMEDVADRLLTEARLAIAANKFTAAEELLRDLLRLFPDNIAAFMTRARLREHMGDRESAIQQWDEAIRRTQDATTREEATAERVRILAEFRAEESRLAAEREQSRAERERERLELEAKRDIDRQHMAEETARQAEQQRLAEETARQAEQQRLAEETARQAEQQRLAEEARQREARLARDQAAMDQAARDQAARDQAARDQAAKDQAAREKAERERVAREQAAQEKAEQQRLAALEAERERARLAATQAPRVVQIDAVRREKLPNRENYEEIRLVRIDVKRRKSGGPIRSDEFRIDVEFFDKDPTTGEIRASGVPAPQTGLTLSEHWTEEDTKSFPALYMVPEGFREQERARTGRFMQFHGYVVRVLYDGQLQDEHAFPGTLLRP